MTPRTLVYMANDKQLKAQAWEIHTSYLLLVTKTDNALFMAKQ
jgi:hypothetical protein